MKTPVNYENLSLEQIAADINRRCRNGVENCVEIGKQLIVAQKKLEETGKTFKEYCHENFTCSLSLLEKYKRVAENLEKALPTYPSAYDDILKTGSMRAADELLKRFLNQMAKAVKTAQAAANAANNVDADNEINGPVDFSDVNEPEDDDFDDDYEPPYEEDDKIDKLRYVLDVASAIIDSQKVSEKEKKRIRDFAAKYMKRNITLDMVPDIERKYPVSTHAHETAEITAVP